MSKQWGHGYSKGVNEGFESGEKTGKSVGELFLAEQFRVLLSALVVAHKNDDCAAFYSTVKIAQTVIKQHTGYKSDDSFKVFK